MASPSDLDAPVHHVVHLVTDFAPPTAPDVLGYPTALTPLARGLLAVALAVGTAAAVWVLGGLWTDETPRLWFQFLFTVFLGGLVVAAWVIAADVRTTGRARATAVATWLAVRDRAVPSAGRLVDRRVSLTDGGGVSGFVVDVDTPGGRLTARWTPHPGRTDHLLQPHVPGIGSAVRVWSVPGDPGSPVVVEVVDPTRVSREGTRKRVLTSGDGGI